MHYDPVQEPDNDKTDTVMATVGETHNIYTDQTEKSPITSSRETHYIVIMYVYNANSILASPLNIRSDSHILEAYNKQVEHITTTQYIPWVYWLDNEASASLRKYKKQKDIEHQLVLPHIHHVNAAEREIRKWINHFNAGISSKDTRLPMHLRCQIFPQATMKLKMMRPCRKNPTMLEYTALEEFFSLQQDTACITWDKGDSK